MGLSGQLVVVSMRNGRSRRRRPSHHQEVRLRTGDSEMSAPGAGAKNGWSFRAQLGTIVAIVALVIAGTGIWLGTVTLHDVEAQARRDATFQARLGAAAVAEALAEGESAMEGLAPGSPSPRCWSIHPSVSSPSATSECSPRATSTSCSLTARCLAPRSRSAVRHPERHRQGQVG
jgi:hypothetical protein